MKRYFEQLTPQERRWVVGIGLIVFLILNWFFVKPYFHAWAKDKVKMEGALKTNNMYMAEVNKMRVYQRKISELQSGGEDVPADDQAINFIHVYNNCALKNKIVVMNQGALVTRTNEFFLEQQLGITVQADETNLVNFLYDLGSGNSMIRVRAMSLHPDPSHERLSASITMIASYQKKVPLRGGTPATRGVVKPAKPQAEETKTKVEPKAGSAAAAHPTKLGEPPGKLQPSNRPAPSTNKRP